MRAPITILFLLVSTGSFAQNQIDFRGTMYLNFEKKISRSLSFTFMNNETMTYDFQELGYFFFDVGARYKITRNISINANYRYLFLRNLDNFYVGRQLIYGDLDLNKSIKRWSLSGTVRFQSYFYTHIVEGYKSPRVYNRDKIKIGYRVNYYLQPFVEAEVFFPLIHPSRNTIDQVRGSIGLGYTINKHIKIELYEQVQQQLNRARKNTNYLTGIEWYYKF